MTSRTHDPITELLSRLEEGDPGAERELYQRLYPELHGLAAKMMLAERRDHTLQPTALVHEAYLGLLRRCDGRFEGRRHFLRAAACIMRSALVDHARRAKAEKRGGDEPESVLAPTEDLPALDVLAVHEAVERLEEGNELMAKIVELRFFGGLTVDETAEALEISPKTVQRRWRAARAFLVKELGL